jgi:probable rRNA maturation factor
MEINVLFDEGLEDCLDTGWLQDIVRLVLTAQGIRPNAEVGLVIASQERVWQLNRDYLGKDEPTDVLAFPMLAGSAQAEDETFATPPDGIKHLGEVLISYPQAARQAEEHRHSVKKEVAVLTIHGILHLLGYDHGELEPAQQMADREKAILNCVEGQLL